MKMKSRKTFKVSDLKEEANRIFLESQDSYVQGRKAIFTFVETILMKTNNYRGFNYIGNDKIREVGNITVTTFGINTTLRDTVLRNTSENKQNKEFWDKLNAVSFNGTDNSRVFFY